MANTTSAKKAARRAQRRTKINHSRIARVRSSVRKVDEALAASDKEAAKAALKAAEPLLMRAAGKGIVHRKTASRKVARLAARVKALAK